MPTISAYGPWPIDRALPYHIEARRRRHGRGLSRTDTKLDRDVAIKVLPDSFAGDPDRMARFQREAQVLASLNHPNIAAIYGVEERRSSWNWSRARRSRGRCRSSTSARSTRGRSRRARSRAREGHRPSRSEAGQHQGHTRRAVKVLDFGLAKATGDGARQATRHLADADHARHEGGRDHRHRRLHGAGTGARAEPSTSAPTSGHSAWCCTNCSPASRLFEGPTVSDTLAACCARIQFRIRTSPFSAALEPLSRTGSPEASP